MEVPLALEKDWEYNLRIYIKSAITIFVKWHVYMLFNSHPCLQIHVYSVHLYHLHIKHTLIWCHLIYWNNCGRYAIRYASSTQGISAIFYYTHSAYHPYTSRLIMYYLCAILCACTAAIYTANGMDTLRMISGAPLRLAGFIKFCAIA